MAIKLNLASGHKPREGYVSVDKFCEADQMVDLEVFPWPWDDNSIDAVYMAHYLEHVQDVPRVVAEVHRILKPGGEWEVRVPHARGMLAYLPYHKQRITCVYMDEIGWNDESWETGKKSFATAFNRLTFANGYDSRFYGKLAVLFPLLEWLANLSHTVRNGWEYFGLPTNSIWWKGIKQ